MRSRRRLALFFCVAVIACVACASRTSQQKIAGLLTTIRRRVGGDTPAVGVGVGRDEFTVRKEKRNRLSEELDPDRELVSYLQEETAPSTETSSESRAHVNDLLTGLLNRRALDEALAGEVDRAKRFGTHLGLVLIDLDNFKAVNDMYGHPQGDVVLRDVARVLRDLLREIDHPARYGGEEFAVILPGSDLEEASNRAEDIRKQIAQLRIPRLDRQGVLRVTASYGAASARGATADAAALLTAADKALYEAKRRGPDDGSDGGVREPRRPGPDRGAGGIALRRPDPPATPDCPKPDVP